MGQTERACIWRGGSVFGVMRIQHSIVHAGLAVMLGGLLWWQPRVDGGSSGTEGATGATDNPFPRLIHVFAEDQGNLRRYYRYPHSQLDRERLEQFYQDSLARLGEIAFGELGQDGRVDYLLWRQYLQRQLILLRHGEERAQEVAAWLDFAPAITRLVEKRRRAMPMDWSKTATELSALATAVGDAAVRLTKEEEMSAVLARRALGMVKGMRDDLADWYGFYRGYDPLFEWWNEAPYEAAKAAFVGYEAALEKLGGDADAVVGDPIGRELLLEALKAEFIVYTPEELIAMAEKEYAWCQREWKRAAQDLGLGDDWRKALDHVKSLHVAPGEQPALIKALADEAVAFLESRDLVTIPPVCKETWRMEMMTPERQKVNPYFTGGEVISVSFPSHEMAHADKLMSLRGNNRHFCKATVHHELIPGHHLQLYMQERYRPYRQLFRTPFLIEGWALYWEMLLWDKDFHEGPEDRVGMLFWRTHRCARIIFSLKFHLGEMSAEECVEYLVKKVGHERRNALAEVRRSVQGGYEPLYQAAYMLGGLQFRALRKELVDGGKMTEKAFHDAILHENAIPVDLIRASLADLPLTPEYQSSWRFYVEPQGTAATPSP